jgi:hypothetical protein
LYYIKGLVGTKTRSALLTAYDNLKECGKITKSGNHLKLPQECAQVFGRWDCWGKHMHPKFGCQHQTPLQLINDPSAGSPTETLLRLLLPLNDQV